MKQYKITKNMIRWNSMKLPSQNPKNCIRLWNFNDLPLVHAWMLPQKKLLLMFLSSYQCYGFKNLVFKQVTVYESPRQVECLIPSDTSASARGRKPWRRWRTPPQQYVLRLPCLQLYSFWFYTLFVVSIIIYIEIWNYNRIRLMVRISMSYLEWYL